MHKQGNARTKNAKRDTASDDAPMFFPPCASGASIALINFSDNGFEVNEDAIAILNGLQGAISVVAVAGVYRTGKSFLLNRVVLQQAAGFNVGPTTRACTKGIWMWSVPLKTKNARGEDVNVLVIDTEGIGAPTADATHDTRIFALGLLLSSYFIYNSVGSIDEQALSNMSLVTNLSKELQKSAQEVGGPSASEAGEEQGEQDEGARLFSPGFLWVVRDFALQLRDDTGKAIGAREYLEDALQPAAAGRGAEGKNRIRSCLREYFPDRDCFTMVRPCTNESQLQNLDAMPNKQLRPEFVAQAEELRDKIFAAAVARPMHVKGYPLTGAMLAMLCESYVAAVNDGRVPDIKDAWTYVCDAQRAQLEQKAMLDFSEEVNKLTAVVQSPPCFLQASMGLKQAALAEFQKSCAALYGDSLGAGSGDTLDTSLTGVLLKTSARHQKQYAQYLRECVSTVLRERALQELPDMAAMRQAMAALLDRFMSKIAVDDDSMDTGRGDDDSGDIMALLWSTIHPPHPLSPTPPTSSSISSISSISSMPPSSPSSPSSSPSSGHAGHAEGRQNAWRVARAHYRQDATALWYASASDALWESLLARYGGMEQQLLTAQSEHERAQQTLQQQAAAHHAEVLAAEAQHREELDKKMSVHKELLSYYEGEMDEKTALVTELGEKLDESSREFLAQTSEKVCRISSLEQELERERMRAETAEREAVQLKAEVDELMAETAVIAEQTRQNSELTLERDHLRHDLTEAKRALQEQKQTLASVESAFKKESKEVQAKVLQSLQTMKETRKVEQLQMKSAKDAALARCALMEGTERALRQELSCVQGQQAEALAVHEQQVQFLRTQMEENEQRVTLSLKDVSTRLQESERQRKDKERLAEGLQGRLREERVRLEQECMGKLKDLESRAVNAESQVSEHRRQLEAAEERWARKRARTDGDSSDKSLQLVKVEAELCWLRQQKSDADAQLSDLRRANHELEQTIRGLERGIDSQMTRAKLEYESRIAGLEHRLMTMTES
jgi:hypothetical protein